VLSAIAQSLGLSAGESAQVDALAAALRERSLLLLVLDNFDQVLGARPAVASLLAACPSLKALVTSRAALRVRGEQEFSVPPLEVPSLAHPPAFNDLARYAAVRLFVERAQAVKPTFELTPDLAPTVAAICARLDGLQLAIELAAARIKVLSPPALLAGLDQRLALLTGGPQDIPERQPTMRQAIAWGYDLLDESERLLFRRLAVFVGGWTLEAATICSHESTSAADLLDVLSALVDASLVVVEADADGESRFRLLELIQGYAWERLVQHGEDATLRVRHAECYLALAERAEPELHGGDQGAWLARLSREHYNLGAALAWARVRGVVELGLRLAWPSGGSGTCMATGKKDVRGWRASSR
jgi:predicted ATPase